jgi:hypothetical protein
MQTVRRQANVRDSSSSLRLTLQTFVDEPMSTDLPKIVVAPVEHRIFIVYAKHDSMDVGHCESSARQAPAAKW